MSIKKINEIYYHPIGAKLYKCELIKIIPSSKKVNKNLKGEEVETKTNPIY